MEDLFEDAQGWEVIKSISGSPSTTIHILRRYTHQEMIKGDRLFCFKTVSLMEPITTKCISNKSISFKCKDYEQVKTEVKALERLKPYGVVAELYQVISERDQKDHLREFFRQFLKQKDCKGKHLCLVMEYCPMGTLKDCLLSQPPLEAKDAIRIALETCQCLMCLQQNQILHRDLRTDNLLMTSAGVKLTDFDAAFIKGYSHVENVAVAVQIETSAPELIALMNRSTAQKEELSEEELFQMQEKCDIYSFGTLLFELLTQKQFEKVKVLTVDFSKYQSNDLQKLVIGMLEEDPSNRISLKQVFSKLEELASSYSIEVRQLQTKSVAFAQVFEMPEIGFNGSITSKTQSNSISLSDWSLQEAPLPLYRKAVEHPDQHRQVPKPKFLKTQTVNC